MTTIEYGALENAKVTIDGEDGAVWLWVTDGNEHAGINLSAQITDPSIDEVVKQWARQQDQQPQIDNSLRSL
jgi:hypothetical protein